MAPLPCADRPAGGWRADADCCWPGEGWPFELDTPTRRDDNGALPVGWPDGAVLARRDAAPPGALSPGALSPGALSPGALSPGDTPNPDGPNPDGPNPDSRDLDSRDRLALGAE